MARGAPERRARPADARATRVLSELNDLRRHHGLVPLRVSAGLTAAARSHSLEMARAGYFAHESLDGSPYGDRILAYYPNTGRRLWAVGENLAWASPDLGAPRTFRLWLRSALHRENLLTAGWREVGVGTVHVDGAPGVFGGASVTILTVDFGVRR